MAFHDFSFLVGKLYCIQPDLLVVFFRYDVIYFLISELERMMPRKIKQVPFRCLWVKERVGKSSMSENNILGPKLVNSIETVICLFDLKSLPYNCMPTWRRTQKSPRCPGDKMNYPQQGCNMSEDQKLQFLVVSQACKFRDDKGRKKKLVSMCRSDQLV